MHHADLIIDNIGQLITCASNARPKRGIEMLDVGIINDSAVAITDGRIFGAGPSREIHDQFAPDERIDARGRVVCPGFIDPHTHIIYAGNRLDEFELKIKGAEYLDILAGGGGILSTVKKTREASVEELIDSALKRLDKMLACGTTTCEIKTGYGLDTETELKMLAVIEELDLRHAITIVPTFLAAHAVPPEFKGDPDGYVDVICNEMLPLAWKWYEQSHFARYKVPFFCDVYCEKGTFTLERSQRLLSEAKQVGFQLKAHVEQFNDLGGTGMAVRLGAASVDHLDAISEDGIANLAGSDTVGVLIPTENFNRAKAKFADARRLIDRGCAIALSTDYNPGSAPCPSQSMAMAIACRYQKLSPAEAMNGVTINASHAIGLGDRRGSIEPGEAADLVIFDSDDYREIAYEFGGNLVRTVIKDGKIVHESN